MIDLILVQHRVTKAQHRAEFWDGEVAIIGEVQFPEGSPEVQPVARQLKRIQMFQASVQYKLARLVFCLVAEDSSYDPPNISPPKPIGRLH